MVLWGLLSGFVVFEFSSFGRLVLVTAVVYVVSAAAVVWSGRGPLNLVVRASWLLAGAWATIAALSWAIGHPMLLALLIALALAVWAAITQLLARHRAEM